MQVETSIILFTAISIHKIPYPTNYCGTRPIKHTHEKKKSPCNVRQLGGKEKTNCMKNNNFGLSYEPTFSLSLPHRHTHTRAHTHTHTYTIIHKHIHTLDVDGFYELCITNHHIVIRFATYVLLNVISIFFNWRIKLSAMHA